MLKIERCSHLAVQEVVAAAANSASQRAPQLVRTASPAGRPASLLRAARCRAIGLRTSFMTVTAGAIADYPARQALGRRLAPKPSCRLTAPDERRPRYSVGSDVADEYRPQETEEALRRGPLTWTFVAAPTGFEPVSPP